MPGGANGIGGRCREGGPTKEKEHAFSRQFEVPQTFVTHLVASYPSHDQQAFPFQDQLGAGVHKQRPSEPLIRYV